MMAEQDTGIGRWKEDIGTAPADMQPVHTWNFVICESTSLARPAIFIEFQYEINVLENINKICWKFCSLLKLLKDYFLGNF